ncbi:ABC transporter ATP-binding protein [Brevibacillus sp. SYP-B805]|uniref:ABC transporter ATP-binding protein n=1 Tax=Brevibacillus sp. SYP-B805 TaxID=1578199 RepID=UPI003217F844
MALKSKLSFADVSFSYGEKPIVQHFSLQIGQGEFVSLIGPSGVGKSTLFQLATGLLAPTAGTISLNGEKERTLLGKVGYMPQKDLLMPWRTVAENAALPLEIKGVDKHASTERVMELLPAFGLKGWEHAYPDQLSGGMRQRVSLLRAVLAGNDLLLLDEPFSALDGITRMEMQEWLLGVCERLGTTIMLITHDIDEAILLADRVLVLAQTPLTQAIEVPILLPRPRRGEHRYDPAFLALREEIWRILQERRAQSGEKGRWQAQ